ncbi:MAG: sugar kinase [Candidatus Eisenbacteria bacterium]|uniref:Sugar kinase n=1 Tax=Eiseniibacteriota bacterium TaxID=2212470 RepID=A0A7Y2H106_UNCEI|nr:sugar kinase [Candidatus Eisenbacteria bacterium]
MSVLVVGSVALDTVYTPNGNVVDSLGGSASFFSMAARHFAPVQLVAVVGEDFPQEHIDLLGKHEVNLEGLEKAPGETFRWSGRYSEGYVTRETLDTQLNVFASFHPKIPATYADSKFVFLANIDPTLQNDVLDQVKDPQLVVLDTMNFWISGARAELDRIISRVDILLLNDEEAQQLTGKAQLSTAAQEILAMGPKVVIIKKGEHGSMLLTKDWAFLASAYPVENLIDPTGAGDTFAGGFLGYLATQKDFLSRESLRQAAVYGTIMASFTVEAFSLERLTQATPTVVDARVKAFREMTEF